jgi:hypothetical protein
MKCTTKHCKYYSIKRWPVSVLCIAMLLCGCSATRHTYSPDKKFSPEALQEDVDILWSTFQQCHPSLYWYTSKDSVDNTFTELRTSFKDSLTEPQFRMVLAKALAVIKCGHTSVRASKAAAAFRDTRRTPIFPLHIKTWEPDSMVVLSNAFRGDSNLTRGTTIRSINGRSVQQLLDSIFQFMSADGWHNSFKYQLLSNNFPAWYKSVFGLSPQYSIDIITAQGKEATVNIKNFSQVEADSIRKQSPSVTQTLPVSKPRKHEAERKLTIDTARSLAIMELNTFSRAQLPGFFRKSFRTLRKLNITNLAIELRENGGGNIMNSTRLAQYISNHPFKVADTVAAKSVRYPRPDLVKNGLIYKLQNWFVASRRSDGRLHYRLYERKFFKPYKKNHFDGQVFILTGGFTFSASTLFINPIKGQKNVTVIGEETGGGAIGNTAVNIPDLKLPNTGVRVRLPLYRLVASSNIPHDGRGILPDIPVPPTSIHLRNRLDPKMLKVYELIGHPIAAGWQNQ